MGAPGRRTGARTGPPGGRITTAIARCDKTETLYHVKAGIYCDCTGDSRLALEAGADLRAGRESQAEFKEPLAPLEGDTRTQGSSILFTARCAQATSTC